MGHYPERDSHIRYTAKIVIDLSHHTTKNELEPVTDIVHLV